MGEQLHVLHCGCGATRRAPAYRTILSCIQCGAAMAPPTIATDPPPRRALVSAATFASQLLATITFALALAWIAALGVIDALTIGILATSAICVFAGGTAHRGSLVALALCSAFDIGVALVTLARLPITNAFTSPPLAHLSEPLANRLDAILLVIGAFAALSALACIAALPQARRFAAWRGEQILHAARVARG